VVAVHFVRIQEASDGDRGLQGVASRAKGIWRRAQA
jgi:hypothetical protein